MDFDPTAAAVKLRKKMSFPKTSVVPRVLISFIWRYSSWSAFVELKCWSEVHWFIKSSNRTRPIPALLASPSTYSKANNALLWVAIVTVKGKLVLFELQIRFNYDNWTCSEFFWGCWSHSITFFFIFFIFFVHTRIQENMMEDYDFDWIWGKCLKVSICIVFGNEVSLVWLDRFNWFGQSCDVQFKFLV